MNDSQAGHSPKNDEDHHAESMVVPLTTDEKELILRAATQDKKNALAWSRKKLIRAAKQTLKPKPPPNSDAFEMFCFASMYQAGSSAIQITMFENHFVEDEDTAIVTRNEHVTGLVIPSAILLCLSFEVYLKCLCVVRGQDPLLEHDTRELFGALEQGDQDLLKRRFGDYSKDGIAFKEMELASVLERTSTFFTGMRYGYDLPVPRMPKHGKVRGTYGLANATNAVRSVILDTHPDWEQRFLDRKSFF